MKLKSFYELFGSGTVTGAAALVQQAVSALPSAIIVLLLVALMGHHAWAQSTRAPATEPNFFYSGGKVHTLKPSTHWAGVQLASGSSPTQVITQFSTRGGIARNQAALRYQRQNTVLLPLNTQPQSVRQNLRAQLKKLRGVRRGVRVFDNGNSPYPIVETDEFLIQFRAGVSWQQAASLLRNYGAVLGTPLGHYAPNGYVAHVTDPNRTATGVANALYGQRQVIFSHPNFIWPMQPRFVPNDPLFSQQWNLHNTGQGGGTIGADIKAEQAWDITRGSSSVVIAVIDTGIDIDHEEFKGRVLTGYDAILKNSDPRPKDNGFGDENHGTEVAGLALAAGNNALGISGVAPNCKLLPIRAITNDTTDEDIADAFTFAVDHGAWVINNSWGPVGASGVPQPLPDVIRTSIDYAVTHGRGGKGCVITWAAGNTSQSSELDGFASYPSVIDVAASTNRDGHSFYSDFGPSIDVCAPSSGGTLNVTSTDRMGAVGDDPGNYTGTLAGTSFAAPQVAGTAALVLSLNPSLTYTQVRDVLEHTADKIDTSGGAYDSSGHSNLYGFGRINAYRALLASNTTTPTITLVAPQPSSTISGIYTVRAKTSNDALVKRVDFARRNQNSIASATRTPALHIPDFATMTDTQTLTATGPIEHANIKVNITHASPSDLVVTLIAPDGTKVVLYNHDSLSAFITDTGLSIDQALSLTGKKIAGAWRLQISDTISGDTGTLDTWSLNFTADWVPIASVTAPVNGEWTALWKTGVGTSTLPSVYEVQATAITAGANAVTESRNVTVASNSYKIAGRVANSSNIGLSNVTLTLKSTSTTSSVTRTVLTNAVGDYAFTNIPSGTYTLTPTRTSTFFSPVTKTVTVSTVDLASVNFTGTVDTAAPKITVTRPAVTPNNRYTSLTTAAGTVSDNVGGSGVAQVTGLLYRYANGTTPAGYWNGTAWTTTYNATTNEKLAIGTTTWSLSLPKLVSGNYWFRATAKDRVGNLARSTVIGFTIVAATTTKSVVGQTASSINLSAASASAKTSLIQLSFTGALDAETAANPAAYQVQINGVQVAVGSAAYSTSHNRVTLALPENSLYPGAVIKLSWHDLIDTQGHPLADNAYALTAH
ncbi:MAG: S8 family serine peptidase [Abitibacteriaceae bacterium]|nr:S8 family serine peptidase [Abditibacteriaceae bacterium]